MAYKMKAFTFFCSYYDAAQDMDDADRLAFYDAVMAYMFDDRDRERKLKQSGRKDAHKAFRFVKTSLISSKNKSRAGKAGNNKRWSKSAGRHTNDDLSQSYRKPIAEESQLRIKNEELRMKNEEWASSPGEVSKKPRCARVVDDDGTLCGSLLYRDAKGWYCSLHGHNVGGAE